MHYLFVIHDNYVLTAFVSVIKQSVMGLDTLVVVFLTGI